MPVVSRLGVGRSTFFFFLSSKPTQKKPSLFQNYKISLPKISSIVLSTESCNKMVEWISFLWQPVSLRLLLEKCRSVRCKSVPMQCACVTSVVSVLSDWLRRSYNHLFSWRSVTIFACDIMYYKTIQYNSWYIFFMFLFSLGMKNNVPSVLKTIQNRPLQKRFTITWTVDKFLCSCDTFARNQTYMPSLGTETTAETGLSTIFTSAQFCHTCWVCSQSQRHDSK